MMIDPAQHTADPKTYYTPIQIACLLKSMEPFYYWANEGNLGDLLIAVATRQFFEQHSIQYFEYNPSEPPKSSYNLVYGGGGRFTSHWGGLDTFARHLCHPNVESSVLLPCSMHNADALVSALDERHVIFCREQKTLNYGCSLNKKSHFYAADDMALLLKMGDLPPVTPLPEPSPNPDADEIYTRDLLNHKLVQKMKDGVCRSSVSVSVHGKKRRIAFLMRGDTERATRMVSPLSYDLSVAWSRKCTAQPLAPVMIRAFYESLADIDTIVTDRLHVAIMGYLSQKEVYMLDNDYGKLRGVYQQSLSHAPHVCYIGMNPLPETIASAWCQLNSPLHRLFCYSNRLVRKALAHIYIS